MDTWATLWIFCILWIILGPSGYCFTYRVHHNPDCPKNDNCTKNGTHLIQVILEHPNRSIHFLLPGNGSGAPLSVVMAEAPAHPQRLRVNYTNLMSHNGTAIWYSVLLPDNYTSYGLVLNEFCPYVDANDDAEISENQILHECRHVFGRNLVWQLSDSSLHNGPLNFVYTANKSTDSADAMGQIIVNITIPVDYSDVPDSRLTSLVPGMGIFMDVKLSKMKLTPKSRFAPIFLVFSADPMEDHEDFVASRSALEKSTEMLYSIQLNQRITLDEFLEPDGLPAIARSTNHTPAYIQWRETCSVSSDGMNRRRVHLGPRLHVPSGKAKKYQFSLPYAVYGDAFNQKATPNPSIPMVGVRMQAVSLGDPGDGFYEATEYVQWQSVLSFGVPNLRPDDSSRRILAVGLSISLLLIGFVVTAGVVYAYNRRILPFQRGPVEDQEEHQAANSDPPHDGNVGPTQLLRCIGGRLRLCRRIPSPEMTRALLTDNGDDGEGDNI